MLTRTAELESLSFLGKIFSPGMASIGLSLVSMVLIFLQSFFSCTVKKVLSHSPFSQRLSSQDYWSGRGF